MFVHQFRALSQATALTALLTLGIPNALPLAEWSGALADTTIVVDIKPSDGKLEAVLIEHAAKARKAKLLPYVELGAKWCAPCKALARSMSDSLMIDAFRGTYIIRVDIDDWKRLHLEDQGLLSDGIPAFFAIDSTGTATGPMITGDAWRENTAERMAPPLKRFFRKQAEAAKKKTS